MKKKISKKLIIIIIVVVLFLVFLVLHLMFGFKEMVISDPHPPGETYYCYRSKITGIYYCKVHHGCSAMDCPSNNTSIKICPKNYFGYLGERYA